MSFKKGDLIGILKDDKAIAYVITKVVREDRFYFGYSIVSKLHRLIVHDPSTCFIICPGFNPQLQPDHSMNTISTEMYDALDKLFGFFDIEDTSIVFDTSCLLYTSPSPRD